MGWISLSVLGGTSLSLGGLFVALWQLARRESGPPALAWFGSGNEKILDRPRAEEFQGRWTEAAGDALNPEKFILPTDSLPVFSTYLQEEQTL